MTTASGLRSSECGATYVEYLVLIAVVALGGTAIFRGFVDGATGAATTAAERVANPEQSSPEQPKSATPPAPVPSKQPRDEVSLDNVELVGNTLMDDHHDDPGIPGLPGPGGPGGSGPEAVSAAAGGLAGGLLACAEGAGVTAAGGVTVVAAPLGCLAGIALGASAGAALPGAISAAWNFFTGDDDSSGGSGEDPPEQSFDDYVESLPKKPTPEGNARNRYEHEVAGDENYLLQGNGEKIWADGIDSQERAAVEAKYIDDPDNSPFIEGSNFYKDPKPWQQSLLNGVDNEFRRYAEVLNDPNVPIKELVVKVSDEDAVPFFDDLMQKYGIKGKVVVQEPNFWYGD